jgi:outer membrane receptor protein involved in Fe transport
LGNNSTTDHYLSYYANGSYTYKDRYIFSASSRIDQSNLFGVTTNLKTVPLWSLGGSWIISKEKFYNLSALPYLKIRVTDGKNGNIDKALSAFVTASTYIYNSYNELSDQIINPPNPLLKWETVSNLNLAVDFATKNNFLTGTLEFYNKNGNLLVGNSAVAPSSGVTSFTGNNASNNTKGVDLTLNFKIISTDRFQWSTTLLYNYSKDEVTKYNLAPSFAIQYMGTGSINPMVGKPVYSIFGFPYAGLDATGNPQGYLNGVVSENYAAIENSSNLSNIKYVGPATPTSFGSFRNAFNYQQFSFSFNIAYEFGYYFRRNSVNYSNLMSVGIGNSFGNPDFDLRWQNPGDEAKTTVPAMIYPDNTARDQLYQYSTALVEKGDNIRLKDIQLAYDIVPKNSRFPFSKIKVYSYINNIGILWRANKEHLDPDDYFFSSGSGTIPRSYAFGANFIFK